MVALAAQAFRLYSTQLAKHPWRTQIVTTGALWYEHLHLTGGSAACAACWCRPQFCHRRCCLLLPLQWCGLRAPALVCALQAGRHGAAQCLAPMPSHPASIFSHRPAPTSLLDDTPLWLPHPACLLPSPSRALGDVLAQRVEKAPFNPRRCLLTAAYGAAFVGPVGHAWYLGLDRAARALFTPGSLAFVGGKVRRCLRGSSRVGRQGRQAWSVQAGGGCGWVRRAAVPPYLRGG